jgi:hypothetical protein
LRESGAKLATDEALAIDQGAGLPANADGTFDVIVVTAWLVLKLK